MKKLVIPFTLVAIIVGLFEQSKSKPNIYVLCIAIVIFMFGIMKLSTKIPSKIKKKRRKKMLIKGDKVSVLDDAIDGIVIEVKGAEVTIETTDGFNLTFKSNELIKIGSGNTMNFSFNKSQVISEKEVTKPNYINKEKKNKKELPVPEFDLHIEKLVKNYKAMNNYDILTKQLDTAKYHIEFAIRNRIPKIVFIHGVGEGVLKSDLDFLLGRYDNIVFQDANYQKYGQGATEVYFKQNVK